MGSRLQLVKRPSPLQAELLYMDAYEKAGVEGQLCHVRRSVYKSLFIEGAIVRDVGDCRYLMI